MPSAQVGIVEAEGVEERIDAKRADNDVSLPGSGLSGCPEHRVEVTLKYPEGCFHMHGLGLVERHPYGFAVAQHGGVGCHRNEYQGE